MLIRIVKMEFKSAHCADFLSLFADVKHKIRSFRGCQHLELLRSKDTPTTFMTYSCWEDASFLEEYRKSDLFRATWRTTKSFFADKPQAWSMVSETVV